VGMRLPLMNGDMSRLWSVLKSVVLICLNKISLQILNSTEQINKKGKIYTQTFLSKKFFLILQSDFYGLKIDFNSLKSWI